MRIECGWCDTHLGYKEGGAEDCVTHGICDDCAAQMRADLRKYKKEQEESSSLEEEVQDGYEGCG